VALAVHVVMRGITREQYDAVRDADGWLHNPPAGGISHLTWWDGTDCHNMDAWESEANFQAFTVTRLGPAMAKAGVDATPEITMYEAHEAFAPAARTVAPSASIDRDRSDNTGILRAAYAAFATGDMDTVFAAFDDAITWNTPDSVAFGGVYHGHQGVGEFFSHLGENYSELRVEPDTYVEDGDRLVVFGHLRGRSVAGNAFDVPFTHAWTMRDGKATTFNEYYDTAKMNAALGVLTTA
jgi:ketosteroid isomerase-like protein